MNIQKITGNIHTSFTYHYLDNEGREQTAVFQLELKRITANAAILKNSLTIKTQMIEECVADWDLYEDEAETIKTPITRKRLEEGIDQNFIVQLTEFLVSVLVKQKLPESKGV